MNASVAIEAETRTRGPALTARSSILIGLVLLSAAAVRFIIVGCRALGSPLEHDYGEGIVWQQMRLMFEGKGYGPIDGFPTIVFHYPPLYHATVEALSATGLDALFAGRLVSFVCTLASAALVGLMGAYIARTDKPSEATVAGIFAGLAVLNLAIVEKWSLIMRVDMLSIALSLLGLWFGLRAITRPASIVPASLCFVAAIFTKQTSIAAPAALFATLLLVSPRTAWRGIVICVGLGGATLLALVVATNGGIIRHLILYNINRFDIGGLALIPAVLINYWLFFAACGIGLVLILRERMHAYRGLSWRDRRRKLAGTPRDAALLAVLLYLTIKTLMSVLIAKSGANANYLIEWMLACAIFIAPAIRKAMGDRPSLASLVVPGALAIPALGTAFAPIGKPPERQVVELNSLSAMVRASTKPVISDDMVVLLRNGKEVVWEPAIFAELASTGHWDERPFVARIRKDAFGFFITEGDRGGAEYDSRYTPAVADAMDAAYPTRCRLAGYVIHLPGREKCPAR
ncbi:MAG: hypothetical protein HOQ20_04245 [Bradyrhizobium sp.]|nr:hypothetical protein [Bradyrhizobium sp.]